MVKMIALATVAGMLAQGACAANKDNSLLKSGDFQAAEKQAIEKLESEPTSVAWWRVRIKSVMHQGDPARAASLYAARPQKAHDKSLVEDMALITLWQALRVNDPTVKIAALDVIERHDLTLFLDEVGGLLSDDDPIVVARAAVTIIKFPGMGKHIRRMLKHPDEAVRAIVAEGIARKGDEQMRQWLMNHVNDPAASVRQQAVRVVPANKQAAIERLAKADKSERVRAAAIRWLTERDLDKAIALASPQVASGGLGMRLAFIAALKRSGNHVALRGIAASDKQHPRARIHAAEAFASLPNEDDPRCRPRKVPVSNPQLMCPVFSPQALISTMLSHRDPGVRIAALRAVPRVYGDKALQVLGEQLLQRDLGVRNAVAREIAKQGQTQRAFVEWHAILEKTQDPALRLDVAWNLFAYGDPVGATLLIEFVRTGSETQKRQAIAAHNSGGSIGGLVWGLGDADPTIRLAAAGVALGKM